MNFLEKRGGRGEEVKQKEERDKKILYIIRVKDKYLKLLVFLNYREGILENWSNQKRWNDQLFN